MINLFFLFLFISSFSVFGSLYDKKYEEIIPISVVGTMLYLYVFYIFNLLHFGFYILLVINVIAYLYFIYKFSKKDKDGRKIVLKNIFTPAFVIYLLGFIFIYVVTMNNKVVLWDELRLWGAYPKILFYGGELQLGNGSQLLDSMRSYNPGMPLFLFFVTKILGVFKEEFLFFGYALVGYSILLPIAKHVTWKSWLKIPFYLFGLLFVPLLFANSNNDYLVYYYTLFIEPALGIIFGYSMYLTFDNILKDKFKYILLMVMVSGMTLFKDTGILFSLTVGMSFILCELFNYKSYKKIRFGIIKLLLVLVIPLVFFGSWKLVQLLYSSENMYTSVLDTNEIVSFFSNPTVAQKQLLSDAKNAVFLTPIVRSNFSSLDRFYTFPVLTVLLVVLFGMFIFICGKKHYKKNIIPIICFGVGSFVFFVGTLFVYFFSIHAVASFPRYISLLFTAGSVILILILVDKYVVSNNKEKFRLNYFACLLLIICLVVLPVKQPRVESSNVLYAVNDISEQYSDEIISSIGSSKNIALVFGCDNADVFSQSVLYHHQIYLDMISNGYGYLDIYYSGDNDVYNTLIEMGYSNLSVSYIDDMNDLKDYDYLYYIYLDSDNIAESANYLVLDMNDSDLFKLSETGEFVVVN